MNKIRLDYYLVRSNQVRSRHQAADLIRRRQVQVAGKVITRPGFKVNPGLRRLVVVKAGPSYVSRGGTKLAAANNHFQVSFVDKVVLDVGCSAGGFSDYALQNQARLVVGVDVGNQMPDRRLRTKSNFHSFIKTDIRHFIWPAEIPTPDLILVDVAFISLTKVLPAIAGWCQSQTELIVLAKPQFEQKNTLETARVEE